VGANRSPHAALFRDRVDRYLGCDLQPAASPYLRIVGAAEHLPIVDASIDTVLCTQVLDDLPEPAALFEEVHRVLAPGGHLILTAPFFWRLHDLPHDYFRFTAPGLRSLCDRSGLTLIVLAPRGGFWATAGQMLSLYVWSVLGRGWAGRGLARSICGPIQTAALGLERLHADYRQTLGYTLVARKA